MTRCRLRESPDPRLLPSMEKGQLPLVGPVGACGTNPLVMEFHPKAVGSPMGSVPPPLQPQCPGHARPPAWQHPSPGSGHTATLTPGRERRGLSQGRALPLHSETGQGSYPPPGRAQRPRGSLPTSLALMSPACTPGVGPAEPGAGAHSGPRTGGRKAWGGEETRTTHSTLEHSAVSGAQMSLFCPQVTFN